MFNKFDRTDEGLKRQGFKISNRQGTYNPFNGNYVYQVFYEKGNTNITARLTMVFDGIEEKIKLDKYYNDRLNGKAIPVWEYRKNKKGLS